MPHETPARFRVGNKPTRPLRVNSPNSRKLVWCSPAGRQPCGVSSDFFGFVVSFLLGGESTREQPHIRSVESSSSYEAETAASCQRSFSISRASLCGVSTKRLVLPVREPPKVAGTGAASLEEGGGQRESEPRTPCPGNTFFAVLGVVALSHPNTHARPPRRAQTL